MKATEFSSLVLIVIVIMLFEQIDVFGQESVQSSGGNTVSSSGNVSYTVGQVFYTDVIGSGGVAAQGIQHPWLVSTITSIEEARAMNLNVFPNPTKEILSISIDVENSTPFRYAFYDARGIVLIESVVESKQTTLDLHGYQPGIYLLKVMDTNHVIATYKIIKQ